ncbi:unnamed protein product [Mesocestoides corti]|uniref:Rad51 domain-containing protein n=1 Tax=Mesocestoides corti TaxID=53468 RepID=A0A0R3UFL8_MESCO|nr:unnamed protein product [Mesocestoides corti]
MRLIASWVDGVEKSPLFLEGAEGRAELSKMNSAVMASVRLCSGRATVISANQRSLGSFLIGRGRRAHEETPSNCVQPRQNQTLGAGRSPRVSRPITHLDACQSNYDVLEADDLFLDFFEGFSKSMLWIADGQSRRLR